MEFPVDIVLVIFFLCRCVSTVFFRSCLRLLCLALVYVPCMNTKMCFVVLFSIQDAFNEYFREKQDNNDMWWGNVLCTVGLVAGAAGAAFVFAR